MYKNPGVNEEAIKIMIENINGAFKTNYNYIKDNKSYILYLNNKRIGERMTGIEFWKVLTVLFSIHNNSRQ